MEATIMTDTEDIVTEFKTLLELEQIPYTYTDEELQLLLNNKLSELTTYTGVNITPTTRKEIRRDYTGDMYEVDYYPICNISNFKIGSRTLTSDDYVLDENLGVVYLEYNMSGMLLIEYTSGFTPEMFASQIKPLLFDMAKYQISTGTSELGVLSSVKEGDVQVNYDTGSSLGGLIQSRVQALRSSYQCRVRVI